MSLWHSLPLHAILLLFPASKLSVTPANPTFLPLSTPVAVADEKHFNHYIFPPEMPRFALFYALFRHFYYSTLL